MSQDDLFQPVIELPEDVRDDRYRRLVGLDHIKTRLRKEATVLANPHALADWATAHHPAAESANTALRLISDRAPLILFGGDVGSGKSALAESFGCDLSRVLDVPVNLYRLKLAARGSGLVGEITSLIGDAFDHLRVQGEKSRTASGGIKAIQIFVVDEADALVQSREATQMHHEDRAGVDAFIAGIDGLAGANLPIVVVLCTNRLNALDPPFGAVRPPRSSSAGPTAISVGRSSPTRWPTSRSTRPRSTSSSTTPARARAATEVPATRTPTSRSGSSPRPFSKRSRMWPSPPTSS